MLSKRLVYYSNALSTCPSFESDMIGNDSFVMDIADGVLCVWVNIVDYVHEIKIFIVIISEIICHYIERVCLV